MVGVVRSRGFSRSARFARRTAMARATAMQINIPRFRSPLTTTDLILLYRERPLNSYLCYS
jgi:hypothetical protein